MNMPRQEWNKEYAEELERLSGWSMVECMHNATGATKAYNRSIDAITAANQEFQSWQYENEF